MHSAFKSFRFYNATATDLEGFESILCDGGLTYAAPDGSKPSAWVGGYYGEDRVAAPAADWSKRWQEWDRGRLELFADSIKSRVLMVNVEHYGDDKLGRLVDLLETIRDFRPELAIGVWSLFPASEWWTVQNYAQLIDWQAGRPHITQPSSWWKRVGPDRVAAFEKWRARNRLIARKLLAHVDALFPAIYPVYDVAQVGDEWKLARNVELVLAEARAIAGELPVIPVYFPLVSSSQKPATPALTRALCGAVLNRADGFAMWSDESMSAEHLAKSADVAQSVFVPGHFSSTF